MLLERIEEGEEVSTNSETTSATTAASPDLHPARSRCKHSVSGCSFKLPNMEYHEIKECKYRPTRCPSLTCPVKPPFCKLLRHLEVTKLPTRPLTFLKQI